MRSNEFVAKNRYFLQKMSIFTNLVKKTSNTQFFDAFQNWTINDNFNDRYLHRMTPFKTVDSRLCNGARIFAKDAVFSTFVDTLKIIFILFFFCLFVNIFVKEIIEPDFDRLNPILNPAPINPILILVFNLK